MKKNKRTQNRKKNNCMTDRSLTPILLYSIKGLLHPLYYDKTKRTNKKRLDIRKIMTQHGRSLTPIIAYDTIGLSHQSYYKKTKRINKNGTR